MDAYDAESVFFGPDAPAARGIGDFRRLRLPSLLATALLSSAIVISAAIGRAISG